MIRISSPATDIRRTNINNMLRSILNHISLPQKVSSAWSGLNDMLVTEDAGGEATVDENVRQPSMRVPTSFNRYRCAVRRLKRKNERLQRALTAAQNVSSVQNILQMAEAHLTPKQLAFFKMQLDLSKCDMRGRRFTDEQMMECLALYHQGPRAYRHLRKTVYTAKPPKADEEDRGNPGEARIPETGTGGHEGKV